MAVAPPPQRKPAGAKGAPPTEAAENLNRTPDHDLTPLQFKVPADFKRAFRRAAFEEEITMVELLRRAFDAWQRQKQA